MYLALLDIVSFWQPSITFVTVIPRCFTVSTHGRGLPQSFILSSCRGFLRYARHFVLHFFGFGSVLNRRLWLAAYSSMVRIISWRLFRDGASAQLLSEYPQIPQYSPLIQHPDPLCSSLVNSPATYMQYAIAAKTRPWSVLFLMEKFGDLSDESHSTFASWFL